MSSSSFAEISPSILFPPVCSDTDQMRNEKQPPPARTHTHTQTGYSFSVGCHDDEQGRKEGNRNHLVNLYVIIIRLKWIR